MPTFTQTVTTSFGEETSTGGIPCREPETTTFTYTNESLKRLTLGAGLTDFEVIVDETTAPKALFVTSELGDVTVKFGVGTVGEAATLPDIPLSLDKGTHQFINTDGHTITRIYITTPASPTTGARIRIRSFQ